MKNAAIIVAAGQGKRMKSAIAKQYLLLHQKPVLYYSIKAFMDAPEIDTVIVVTGSADIEYVWEEIIRKYHFSKVKDVVAGGRERYHSVYNGLLAVGGCEYVFIHDGARPFIDTAVITRACEAVREHRAVVVGMPVSDTVKIASPEGYIDATPLRELVWTIQTPQVFSCPLILEAYQVMLKQEESLQKGAVSITDDAMVVERFTKTKVKLVEGSYRNMKITTPEDIKIAEALMAEGGN